jgi:hypothetical protein
MGGAEGLFARFMAAEITGIANAHRMQSSGRRKKIDLWKCASRRRRSSRPTLSRCSQESTSVLPKPSPHVESLEIQCRCVVLGPGLNGCLFVSIRSNEGSHRGGCASNAQLPVVQERGAGGDSDGNNEADPVKMKCWTRSWG